MLQILKSTVLLTLLVILFVAPVMAAEFLLFYTNDVRGETEPCGCSAKQQGGMSRKAAQIKQVAAAEKLPYLFLDSGALLFKQTRLPKGEEEQAKIAAQGIIEAMQSMNCQATGIEAHDLAGGVDLLQQFQEKGKLKWLSMNLVDANKKKTLFTPFLLTETAELSIAVLGLTDEKIPLSPQDKKKYTLLSWEKTLPKVLAQVKKKADMIILLSSYPYAINKKIAEAYPEINLLLSSGPAAATAYPFMVKETVFAQTGPRGKNLGVMRIVWTETGQWDQNDFSAIRMKQGQLDRSILQMQRLEQQHENWDLSKDKDWQKLLAEKKEIESTISTMLRKQKPKDKTLSRFTARFIPLESSLPEDPTVLAIMNKTIKQINTFSKGEKVSNLITTGKENALRNLVGWKRCSICHATQAAFWQKTSHARSMTSLEAKHQQFNPDCVICHVTLPEPEISTKIKAEKMLFNLPEDLRYVGCESCHGSGAAHDADPTQVAVPNTKPSAQICTTCHQSEHDGHFVFAEKEKLIHCPKSAVELQPEKR